MNWFYHAPGRGRVGPVSADDLTVLYRERAIDRDTLVWREGLREWQPLDRVAEELGLLGVVQDTARPPPLPPVAPAMAAAAVARGPRGARQAPAKKPMSGCLIALIVLLVLAVPAIAILAAIAVPAYQDYVLRSKVRAFVQPRAQALQAGVAQAKASTGRCPSGPAGADLPGELAAGVEFGADDDGHCAFQLTLGGLDPRVDGRTVEFVAGPNGAWHCSGGTLPAKYRPVACRAAATE